MQLMITKKCRGHEGILYCREVYPDGTPLNEFYKSSASNDGLENRCKICTKVHNREQHSRNNPKRKLWYGLAGGQKEYYNLSRRERLYYRRVATEEYNNMKKSTYQKVNGKYKKDNPEAQRLRNIKHEPRRNYVAKMVAMTAGGYSEAKKLPKNERLRLRAIAYKQWEDDNGGTNLPTFRTHRKLSKVDRPKSIRVTTKKIIDPRGYVYIFKDHMKSTGRVGINCYKVGASYNTQERLNQANTWGDFECLYESEMVDECVSLEKEVHQALSKYRVKGEWFQCDKTFIINKIEELVDARKEQAVAEQKVS